MYFLFINIMNIQEYQGANTNFILYMAMAIRKLYLSRGVCTSMANIQTDEYLYLYYVMNDKSIYCADGWTENIINLLSDNTCKIIYQPLCILFSDNEVHLGILIIDKVNKLIQRYDPHGVYSKEYKKDMKIMDFKIKEYFLYPGIIDKYIPPIKYCPAGPQRLQEPEKDADKYGRGYCVMWTFWYLENRLKYSDLSLKELEKKINEIFKYYKSKGFSKSKIIYNYAIHYIKRFEKDTGLNMVL